MKDPSRDHGGEAGRHDRWVVAHTSLAPGMGLKAEGRSRDDLAAPFEAPHWRQRNTPAWVPASPTLPRESVQAILNWWWDSLTYLTARDIAAIERRRDRP
jgi:hypothetical protein